MIYIKKISWVLIGILSSLIGLYPLLYFKFGKSFGLLSLKPKEIIIDNIWNVTFYLHITFGGIALLIGWLQFNKAIRNRNIKLHRSIGKFYMFSVLISGISGLYIAFFANEGIISKLGFISLSIVWLISTIWSYKAIKNRHIVLHKKLIVYSYATCFAAVTLRVWLPLLTIALGTFSKAYPIVAWLCWVPNIIVAYFINMNTSQIVKE